MSGLTDSLDPPLFLLAMPQVGDPFFHRSVVLLLEHDAEGSFGFIVNRPTELRMSEVVGELGVAWGGPAGATSWLGGPVQPNVGTILFDPGDAGGAGDAVQTVHPRVAISNDVRIFTAIAAAPPTRFRLLLGHAGWGPGQLEAEIERSDWLIAPFDAAMLFADDPSAMWTRALGSIGVRPEALPSWTIRTDEEASN